MTIKWRKSSHSGLVNDQACIELAQLTEGVGVRDSKLLAAGHLTLSPAGFSALVASVKHAAPRP